MSFVTRNEKDLKSIFLNDVDDPTQLTFDSDGTDYFLYSTENPNKFHVKFEPKSNSSGKSIKIYNKGALVSGCPFSVAKKYPDFEVDENNNLITFTDIENPNLIQLQSSRKLDYDIFEDKKEPSKFHLQFKNQGNIKAKVNITYDGHILNKAPINIGKNELIEPGKLLMSSMDENNKQKPDLHSNKDTGSDKNNKLGRLINVHNQEKPSAPKLQSTRTNNGKLLYSGRA
ncbi:hypothetical protein MHBO_001405 [Bonamia ostreae]|uniref:Uncharacterized protein n=1 Tax=Bonamia ostreae TaxID=126728 RepID=A0ABV2AIW6_9EUKA